MKLWILASWWPTQAQPYNGQIFRDLSLGLAQSGLDVTLICPEMQSPWVFAQSLVKSQWLLASEAGDTPLPALRTRALRPPKRFGLWCQSQMLQTMLDKAVRQSGLPDKILVLSGVNAAGLPRWLDKLAQPISLILAEHHSGLTTKALPRYWLDTYKALLARADTRIAVSLFCSFMICHSSP